MSSFRASPFRMCSPPNNPYYCLSFKLCLIQESPPLSNPPFNFSPFNPQDSHAWPGFGNGPLHCAFFHSAFFTCTVYGMSRPAARFAMTVLSPCFSSSSFSFSFELPVNNAPGFLLCLDPLLLYAPDSLYVPLLPPKILPAFFFPCLLLFEKPASRVGPLAVNGPLPFFAWKRRP